MDLVTSVEGVEVLGLIKVPKHGSTIFATGGAEGSVGGDGDSVDVSSVSNVVGLDSARNKFPNLNQFVPTSGDDDRVLWVGGESHTRNPFGVSLVSDGKLAVTEGVPELNALVTRTRDDLPVVGGERDGKDIASVSNKSSGGDTSGELPQSEGLVPRRGESVGTVGGNHTVGDDVRVTMERPLWNTVALVVTGKVPDNQRLVTRTRQKHVGALKRSSKTGNPSAVTLQSSSQDHVFPHDCCWWCLTWWIVDGYTGVCSSDRRGSVHNRCK